MTYPPRITRPLNIVLSDLTGCGFTGTVDPATATYASLTSYAGPKSGPKTGSIAGSGDKSLGAKVSSVQEGSFEIGSMGGGSHQGSHNSHNSHDHNRSDDDAHIFV